MPLQRGMHERLSKYRTRQVGEYSSAVNGALQYWRANLKSLQHGNGEWLNNSETGFEGEVKPRLAPSAFRSLTAGYLIAVRSYIEAA